MRKPRSSGQVARIAFVLMMLTPSWSEEDGEFAVNRRDLHARWLELHPHDAEPVGPEPRSRASRRIKEGLTRLESAGKTRRVGVGAEQSVLLLDMQGLCDLALLHLDMTEKQPKPREPTHETTECPSGKKWAFETEHAALLELLRSWRQSARGRAWRREQRAYPCNLCSGWHLTSKEDRFPSEMSRLVVIGRFPHRVSGFSLVVSRG